MSDGLQLQLSKGRYDIGPVSDARLLDAERVGDSPLRTEMGDCIFLQHRIIIAGAIEVSIARAIKIQKTIAGMYDKPDGRASAREPDLSTVGGRVQKLREARKWSQAALAKSAGISQPTLANFERGKTRGGLALTIAKLAKALGVDPEWLRTGKGNPTRHLDARTDEQEALVIYRTLSEEAREGWMAAGRAMVTRKPKK